MPNSLVQGLTTSTAAELNRLPPRAMITLLGLLSLVDPRRPGREVRARPAALLDILDVGRTVAHAVTREWQTADGSRRSEEYACRRHSPAALERIRSALVELHDRTVVVQSPAGRGERAVRAVHVLDSFGFVYRDGGREVDVDDLPPGCRRVNVGSDKRPLWRLRRQSPRGEREVRTTGIVFRLNAELAAELSGGPHTIGFTVLARRAFPLLRRFRQDAAAVRLVLLVLRQTGATFTRRLGELLEDLGLEPGHPARGLGRLEKLLERLVELSLIRHYEVDPLADRLHVERNPDWYREEGPPPVEGGPFLPPENPVFTTRKPGRHFRKPWPLKEIRPGKPLR